MRGPAEPGGKGERGAALLTVLLLVAVIAVLAGTALEKLRLATRVGGNAVALDQARAYSLAAETLAVVKVTDLLQKSQNRVTLQGNWSDTPFALPIPNGSATARVTDGGNCFNLNSLVVQTAPGAGNYAAYTTARLIFARLIRLVDPGARSPDAIAAAASDWIDSDNAPLDGGAEDTAYGGGRQGYRTANTLMSDPSELRAVAGVTRTDYEKLRPWLCTLPRAEVSKINVNTLLPEQAPLLAMLLPNTLSVEGARQILLRRPPQGFPTAQGFWSQAAVAGGPGDAIGQTDITTKWFTLKVDVTLGGAVLEQSGLIDASALPARLVSRQWGERP
ncbi:MULTISPECIES: type II secretion system minor pseudopilin GspK [unclassified Sphingomonas]|uniref:type II secretion system minor pseudopilin GspK n=1 Tax=unclassified Sphingomonas TaxID=196159 RepID=UPI001F5AC53C|nr:MULTISPECIES: type II secretion system minor pseudopilin GspK [unclassified Sphingomonas]